MGKNRFGIRFRVDCRFDCGCGEKNVLIFKPNNIIKYAHVLTFCLLRIPSVGKQTDTNTSISRNVLRWNHFNGNCSNKIVGSSCTETILHRFIGYIFNIKCINNRLNFSCTKGLLLPTQWIGNKDLFNYGIDATDNSIENNK